VKVRLDRRTELVAGAAEFAERATDHAPELGELAGAEHQQGKHPDDEHLLKADVEHRG